MDATSDRPRRWRRRRRGHRHRPQPQFAAPADTSEPLTATLELTASLQTSPPPPPQRSDSMSARFVQYVENKMGLPPPYEQPHPNPAPPPSYFGDNPPQPAGFVVPAATPRTTVITSGASARPTPPAKMGPGPTGTTCASCNKSIVTRVDYVPNNRTHIVSAALCVLAGCCCACFVPYCMRSCKTANHYCPQCRAFVGSYTPS